MFVNEEAYWLHLTYVLRLNLRIFTYNYNDECILYNTEVCRLVTEWLNRTTTEDVGEEASFLLCCESLWMTICFVNMPFIITNQLQLRSNTCKLQSTIYEDIQRYQILGLCTMLSVCLTTLMY